MSFANGDISAWAHAPIFSIVTPKKILGGTYGALIIPSITNQKLAVLNFRYLWETGTKLDTQGGTMVFTATFKVK